MQSFLPGFNEVIIETLHHAFHHKLLWQRLRTQQKTNVRPCKTCNQKHQIISLLFSLIPHKRTQIFQKLKQFRKLLMSHFLSRNPKTIYSRGLRSQTSNNLNNSTTPCNKMLQAQDNVLLRFSKPQNIHVVVLRITENNLNFSLSPKPFLLHYWHS